MTSDHRSSMHNVNVDAVEHTSAKASSDPKAVVQQVTFDGEWQMKGPQFRASIPVPNGERVVFEATSRRNRQPAG